MAANTDGVSVAAAFAKLMPTPPMVPGWALANSPAAQLAREMQDRQRAHTAMTTAWTPASSLATAWMALHPPLPTFPLVPLPETVQVPGIKKLLERLARRFPANWPADRPDLDVVSQIVESEGIPLAYVPRDEVVIELTCAANRDARVEVLLDRTLTILDDCDQALAAALSSEVGGQRSLLQSAVGALRGGHGEAAQALAVNVCDTLIGAHIDYGHGRAKNLCRLGDLDEAFMIDQLRIKLGVAPVVNLLTDWNIKSGRPRPAALSRHVTIHGAHPDHYTPANAIIAVMVATGLMLALAELHSKAA